MLPIETAALLLLLFWGTASAMWVAVFPYWERKFMTAARKREVDAKKAERRRIGLGTRAWTVTAIAVTLVLPALFVIDGLVFRFGVLYAPSLSFFTPLDVPVQVVGIVLCVVALVLMVGVGRRLSVHVYSKAVAERTLLTTGIYAYIRHPFYLSFVLLPIGLLLLTLNYVSLLLVLFYNTPDGPVSPATIVEEEERELVARYGSAYEDYMKRTGRLLPKFRR